MPFTGRLLLPARFHDRLLVPPPLTAVLTCLSHVGLHFPLSVRKLKFRAVLSKDTQLLPFQARVTWSSPCLGHAESSATRSMQNRTLGSCL